MGQMYGLSEAAAIHRRIEDPQYQGYDGEKAHHCRDGPGRQLAENAGDKQDSAECFSQCEKLPENE